MFRRELVCFPALACQKVRCVNVERQHGGFAFIEIFRMMNSAGLSGTKPITTFTTPRIDIRIVTSTMSRARLGSRDIGGNKTLKSQRVISLPSLSWQAQGAPSSSGVLRVS